MENEYQKALNYITSEVFTGGNSILETEAEAIKKLLQQLIDQTKTPTLEEVKKEWEEEGYSFEIYNDEYHNGNVYKRCVIYKEIFMNKRLIVLHYWNKTITFNYFWETFDDEGYTVNKYMSFNITFQEHQLLTKTFKALGWFDE